MKILLIGGNGFIGSHLQDKLMLSGNSLRVYDRGYEKYREPNDKVEYILGELTDEKLMFKAMKDIDIVIHLASSSVPSSSNNNIKNDVINNILPTLKILDNMVKLKIKKIVYFSSGGAIYGNSEIQPLKENSPLNPISSYGITKLTIEKYVNLYSNLFNISHLIIRPSNPYGPRQGNFKAQGIISTFLRKIKEKETLQVFGNGESKKDYLYIEDLVDRVVFLIENNNEGVFNIGSGTGTSINEIKNLCIQVSQQETPTVHIESKIYDVSDFVLDVEKIERIYSKEKIELTKIKVGIEKTWNWVKKIDLI